MMDKENSNCWITILCTQEAQTSTDTFWIPVIQILYNIGSVPFISWAILMTKHSGLFSIFSCPSTDVPSFVENYIIFDGAPKCGNGLL
jgi:hypothetical protein